MSNSYKQEAALTYELIGKIERLVGNSSKSAESYNQAVELYHELGKPKLMQNARCFAAISIGLNF